MNNLNGFYDGIQRTTEALCTAVTQMTDYSNIDNLQRLSVAFNQYCASVEQLESLFKYANNTQKDNYSTAIEDNDTDD